jgi:hypothetical protein
MQQFDTLLRTLDYINFAARGEQDLIVRHGTNKQTNKQTNKNNKQNKQQTKQTNTINAQLIYQLTLALTVKTVEATESLPVSISFTTLECQTRT